MFLIITKNTYGTKFIFIPDRILFLASKNLADYAHILCTFFDLFGFNFLQSICNKLKHKKAFSVISRQRKV